MPRQYWVHIGIAILVAVAAMLVVHVHRANGAAPDSDSVSAGHRLAEAWCTSCHAIGAKTAGTSNTAPDFVQIAGQPATTALALKVFLRSNHRNMPNLVLTPGQADDLASYILSLKRN